MISKYKTIGNALDTLFPNIGIDQTKFGKDETSEIAPGMYNFIEHQD